MTEPEFEGKPCFIDSFYNKYRVIELNKEIMKKSSEVRSRHTF